MIPRLLLELVEKECEDIAKGPAFCKKYIHFSPIGELIRRFYEPRKKVRRKRRFSQKKLSKAIEG